MPDQLTALYGSHDIPCRIASDGIRLELRREEAFTHYTRVCREEQTEKILLAKNARILINPAEPVNKPREITSYLLINFNRNVAVEPRGRYKIYLTFPVAIGVFLQQSGITEVLDIFTLAAQKYSLYGDPHSGVICRYWESEIFSSMPPVHPLHEGVMELTLHNTGDTWTEVTKSVFNAYGMKIYYSSGLVAMKARMRITNAKSAETVFRDSPLSKNMKKSLELYTVRKLSVLSPAFSMAEGL